MLFSLDTNTDHPVEELFTLRSQRTESSQKLAHLDVEVSELKMASDSAKVSYRDTTGLL